MPSTTPDPVASHISHLSTDKLSVNNDGHVVVKDAALAAAVKSGSLASLRSVEDAGNNGCGNNLSCMHGFNPAEAVQNAQ